MTFIHELLIEKEAKCRYIENQARKILYAAEEDGKPTEQLAKDKDLARDNHSKALAALTEFETHEW